MSRPRKASPASVPVKPLDRVCPIVGIGASAGGLEAIEPRLQAHRTEKAPPPAELDALRLLRELQVHQVELETQNEELLAARAEAEAVLKRYTDLYDFAPVGDFTLGRDGGIRQVNLTGARLLGVDRSALSNRRFELFVSEADRAVFNGFLDGVFEGKPHGTCEVALCRPGHSPASPTGPGEESVVHVRIEAAVTEDGQICRAVVTDITERRRIEDALRFLVQCGSTPSGGDFFRTLARYLAQSLGLDFVCIDRLEGDGLTARTVAVWCDGKFEDNVTYALKDTPCGEVVGKTVCCFPANVCQFFPRDAVLQDLRAESYVGVTLWSHTGQPIGLIAVIGRRPLTNPRLAESVLALVAVRAAGELERKQAEDALAQSARNNEILMDSLPHPAMLIRRDRTVLAVNRIAREMGTAVGSHCWQSFGHGEFVPPGRPAVLRAAGGATARWYALHVLPGRHCAGGQ